MGGSAISNAQRMDTERYKYVCLEVSKALSSVSCIYNIVKAYKEKDSFGDIDIVIMNFGNIRERVHNMILSNVSLSLDKNKPVEFVKNGPVTSYGILGHQVDLIFEDYLHYDFSCNYYSYNDICNLIGRITHKMGFKFGHDGLWYILRDKDRVIKEILITTNFKLALEVFSFDYERFSQGFNNLQEIFEYISSNSFFNPDIYILQNRNHTARVRDRKRKTYMSFLEYCSNTNFEHIYYFDDDKTKYFELMLNYFPQFKKEYDKAIANDEIRKLAKTKLTTQLIIEHTGLSGKQLGQYISATVDVYKNTQDWYDLIMKTSIKDILKMMDKNYDNIRNISDDDTNIN